MFESGSRSQANQSISKYGHSVDERNRATVDMDHSHFLTVFHVITCDYWDDYPSIIKQT